MATARLSAPDFTNNLVSIILKAEKTKCFHDSPSLMDYPLTVKVIVANILLGHDNSHLLTNSRQKK